MQAKNNYLRGLTIAVSSIVLATSVMAADVTDAQRTDGKSVAALTINPNIPDNPVLGKGPFGEEATSAKALMLTADEVAKIRQGGYKAAIVMHYSGTDYMAAQVEAMKKTFETLGIEVVAVTDALFKAERQVADIETVLATSPDVIVTVPVDPVSTAPAYKKAAAAGVKIVFMDGVANDMEPGKDYVSLVSGDNYGNGIEAAEAMAAQLGGKGKVGVIFHDADFFVTAQRTAAFEETIRSKYPDIELVARGGITGPNDGEKVASAMLTRYSDLDGIFVIWDVPAEGAVAAARTSGNRDLVITSTDLGTHAALEIASDGILRGVGAQLPYDQGVAQAMLAGYALLEKDTPPYVATPALRVTKDNLLESWQLVYGQKAPEVVAQRLNKSN